MRIVIAPDKFKGSLSAPDVARHLENGAAGGCRTAGRVTLEVLRIPVADGGEGTLDAAVGSGFTRRSAVVSGPTGQPLTAEFAVRGREAVIEMAAASGLAVLPGVTAAGGPDSATGQGTATQPGHRRTDPGSARRRLPADHPGRRRQRQHRRRRRASCRDSAPGSSTPTATNSRPAAPPWRDLAGIDFSGFDSRLDEARFILASDVDNPLLGPGRRRRDLRPAEGRHRRRTSATLDAALANFVQVLAGEIGPRAVKAADAPGAGAAGGVGYAAIAVLAATRRPGIDVVLEFTRLADRLAGADLVITGEGSLDEQSLLGKTPMGVARAAAAAGVPVVAVCGRTTLTPEQQQDSGFRQVYPLTALESQGRDMYSRSRTACLKNWESTSACTWRTPPARACHTKEPLNV